jgi:hypothetical protein
MLALVGAGDLFVAGQSARWTAPLVMDWQATRQAAARKATGCDLLCLGSSMVKYGVLPRVIEARTGRRGYNLAVPGSHVPAAYFVLRRSLDHGARPSAVIVDFPRGRLGEDPCDERSHTPWAQLLGPGELFDLARAGGDAALFARHSVAGCLPSVRFRHEIRAAVVAVLGNRFVSREQPGAALARNRRLNRGAIVSPKALPFADIPAPRVTADRPEPWSCHPVNAGYLRRFLELTAARGAAVYWLLPPLSPGHQAAIDHNRAEETFLEALRRLVARYPHVTVVDGRHAGFPLSAFTDPVHLDRTGAAALSESLAALLGPGRSRGPNASWVDLPDYAGAGVGARIEDVVQSAIALGAGKGTVRR